MRSTNKDFSYLTFLACETTLQDLQNLKEQNIKVDALIVQINDLTPTPRLDEFGEYIKHTSPLLNPLGSVLFIKDDWALLLSKEELGERFGMSMLDPAHQLFTLHPQLAEAACSTNSSLDRRRTASGVGLLSHILDSSTPVLTAAGRSNRQLLLQNSSSSATDLMLLLIDDFLTIAALSKLAQKRYSIESNQVITILQQFDLSGLIYPIFSRLEFLSGCYHHHKPFRLGSYLVASKIISEPQLQDLLEKQISTDGRPQKLLGKLAVESNYLSNRQLEVMLFDQFVYGRTEEFQAPNNKSSTSSNSILGYLGTMSPAGLLQSLASDSKTGLLSVEHNSKTLVVAFVGGKVTHAKLQRLQGRNAITEFLANWREGIFVFKDNAISADFDASCQVEQAIEKMFLSAALAEDQNNQIIGLLSEGLSSVLAPVWDIDQKTEQFLLAAAQFIDETVLSTENKKSCLDLMKAVDGLATINDILLKYDHWTTNEVLKHLHVLMVHKLLAIQAGNIMVMLSRLQRFSALISKEIGVEENLEMLRASVEDSSPLNSSIFQVDNKGRLNVNLGHFKDNGEPIAKACLLLEALFKTYLSYCAAELETEVLNRLLLTSQANAISQSNKTAISTL